MNKLWKLPASRAGKLLVVAVVVAALPITSQASVVLPAPNPLPPNPNVLTYGDFYIYSMAFLHFASGGGTNLSAGDPYYVASAPGEIASDLKIATFPQGARANNSSGADDAYQTSNSAYTYFRFGDQADPDPTFPGDIAGSWDVEVGVLNSKLGASNLVFWFNLNETGEEAELAGADLLAWAQVTLVGKEGFSDLVFTLNGTNSLVGPYADANRADWAYVHSTITVDPNTLSFVSLGPPTPEQQQAGLVGISQNLGANNAAFGAYNPWLDLAVKSGNYSIMRVQLELGEGNNGYEQLFIRGANVVPEPATCIVWSLLGAIGVCYHVRRRRK